MFEPLVDKDFILRMSRQQILEESDNPHKIPYYTLSYHIPKR